MPLRFGLASSEGLSLTPPPPPRVSPAGHEAPEGDGAAGEKPEGAVGETGEVQRAGAEARKPRAAQLPSPN